MDEIIWNGDCSWNSEANVTKNDHYLLNEIKKNIEKYQIEKIYETGTFVGGMTKEFSKIVNEVESIEINPKHFSIAQENLKGISNIKLHLGNSPEILNNIVEEKNDKVLFFLDAHWYQYIPLFDELIVISKKNIKPVIIIDDFVVPGKPEWGGSSPMDFESIKKYLNDIYQNNFHYYFNKKTTNNRGRIFVTPYK